MKFFFRFILVPVIIIFSIIDVNAQQKNTEEEKALMLKLVKEGLENKPESFFNLGSPKYYDYKKNINVTEIIIPDDPDISNPGGTVLTFVCILKYTEEGADKSRKFKVMARTDKKTGNMAFYSAHFMTE